MDDGRIVPADLTHGALAIAVSYLGTKETKPNSGPDVDLFLASVGLHPGYPWCAAFAFYCYMRASAMLGLINPCPRSARALGIWALAEGSAKVQRPAVGSLFVLDTGKPGGDGHIGFVEKVHGDGLITTVEGNTNEAGGREGNAVARHERWDPQSGARGQLVGYVDLSRARLRAVARDQA